MTSANIVLAGAALFFAIIAWHYKSRSDGFQRAAESWKLKAIIAGAIAGGLTAWQIYKLTRKK